MIQSKEIDGFPFVTYTKETYSTSAMIQKSDEFYKWLDKRRTIRDFSDKPIPKEVIENIIRSASSAPSGAHKQPWTFCVVSDNNIKKQIREAAEIEEYESYHGRMPDEWLNDLKPLQTDWKKEFLETAPYLIIVFKKSYDWKANKKTRVYYANESVGLACGFL
ncbi:MAG: nitroreductase family protein, partial [Chitinophagaceae bacterium]|nr:nitroreductase family protein [Chitinophagaceae bacterium]